MGLYAYGFRYYDPAIGRFTGVDPIADHFAHLSTYNYASNDPISNIDLHGLQGVKYYDAETNTTTFNLNVVMLVGTTGEHESNLTANDKQMIEESLALLFGGTHETKDGEKFEFTFDVTVKDFSTTETKTKKKGEVKEKQKDADIGMREVGITLPENSHETTTGLPSYPLLLATGEAPGTDGGIHKTVTTVDPNGKEGFAMGLLHEALHHMLSNYSKPNRSSTSMHHSLGGGLGRPLGSPLINQKILEKLKQHVPDGKPK